MGIVCPTFTVVVRRKLVLQAFDKICLQEKKKKVGEIAQIYIIDITMSITI